MLICRLVHRLGTLSRGGAPLVGVSAWHLAQHAVSSQLSGRWNADNQVGRDGQSPRFQVVHLNHNITWGYKDALEALKNSFSWGIQTEW